LFSECGVGYFGFQCGQLCGCENNAMCNPVTGACTCEPGWSGPLCKQRTYLYIIFYIWNSRKTTAHIILNNR